MRRIVKAKSHESLSTSSMTGALSENMYANLSWNAMINTQKKSPIIVEVITETFVANFAALPLPAPSSFAILTLLINTHNALATLF